MGHQGRILVLLGHDRVLLDLADRPEVGARRRLDHQDRAGRELGGNDLVEDGDPGRPSAGPCFDSAKLDQRVGLEHLFEEQVAVGDERHRLDVAAREDRPGPVVGGQGVGAVDLADQLPAVGRGLLEHLAVRLAGLEPERDDVDRAVVEVDLQPGLDGRVGGVDDLDQDLVADRVDQAPADLELGDPDVPRLARADADDLDVARFGELRRVLEPAVGQDDHVRPPLFLGVPLVGQEPTSQLDGLLDPGRPVGRGDLR